VSQVYFVGTKLEAYKGRSTTDPLASHNREDVLTLVDGRDELVQEIFDSNSDLREYFQVELQALLKYPQFEYALQSATGNIPAREKILADRIQKIIR